MEEVLLMRCVVVGCRCRFSASPFLYRFRFLLLGSFSTYATSFFFKGASVCVCWCLHVVARTRSPRRVT